MAAVAERSALADVQALGHARDLVRDYLTDAADVDRLVQLDDLELALVRLAAMLTASVSGASGVPTDTVLEITYQTLARATVDG